MIARLLAVLALVALAAPAQAEPRAILVTIDGLRWQEVFRGPDPALDAKPEDRGRVLMPFLRSFAAEGALIGDRDAGSCMRVENPYWFSFPGYAEMLTGRPNPKIRSNRKQWNREVTTLEWLNGREDFRGLVRVFAEWDRAPYIVNTRRSGLPVFVAEQSLEGNRDAPTMAAAQEFFPSGARAAWVDLGDTDTRAHKGDYPGVLDAAEKADRFLAELWARIEADPHTAGQTTLLVTVDHGRGEAAGGKWRGHGSGRIHGLKAPVSWPGSDATWMAARGPAIRPGAGGGYTMEHCATTAQIAATLLASLGVAPSDYRADDLRPPLDILR